MKMFKELCEECHLTKIEYQNPPEIDLDISNATSTHMVLDWAVSKGRVGLIYGLLQIEAVAHFISTKLILQIMQLPLKKYEKNKTEATQKNLVGILEAFCICFIRNKLKKVEKKKL